MTKGQLLRSDQAKAFRRQHQAPCSDCPWARKSLKGWTGPNSTDTWLRTAHDYWHKIVCHTRKIFGSKGHWECAGAAIYRANCSVMPFDLQPHLRLPVNKITVFASPMEFRAHHGKGIEL